MSSQSLRRQVSDVKPQAPRTEQEAPENNGLVPVASPMVGTFYRSSSPSAPPFVEVGDTIAVGQTVCIIEAMKLMNDLPAEVAGRIVKVCVENGTTVEYGQPLFMVNPRGVRLILRCLKSTNCQSWRNCPSDNQGLS